MQELLVYIIIITAVAFTILATVKKIIKLNKTESNQSTVCSGCSGCSLTKNSASCNTQIQQIRKFH